MPPDSSVWSERMVLSYFSWQNSICHVQVCVFSTFSFPMLVAAELASVAWVSCRCCCKCGSQVSLGCAELTSFQYIPQRDGLDHLLILLVG